MITKNLECNCSYLQFSISRYEYILECPDFKFGKKSQHDIFSPQELQRVTLDNKNLHATFFTMFVTFTT